MHGHARYDVFVSHTCARSDLAAVCRSSNSSLLTLYGELPQCQQPFIEIGGPR
jgi:hypothetical protein